MKKLLWLLVCSAHLHLQANGWLNRKAEGWVWYEELQRESAPLESTVPPAHSAVKILQKVRGEIEEKLSLALVEPTLDNIRSYLKLQKKWMDQSALFANMWAKVLLNEPDLDNSIPSPTNHFAQKIQRQNQQILLNSSLSELSRSHALLFFFDADAFESQLMAGVVLDFASEYGWKVVPISKDGKGIPLFPNPTADKGIWEHAAISSLPTLRTVHPITGQMWHVGTGILTHEQIKENIAIQHNLK